MTDQGEWDLPKLEIEKRRHINRKEGLSIELERKKLDKREQELKVNDLQVKIDDVQSQMDELDKQVAWINSRIEVKNNG